MTSPITAANAYAALAKIGAGGSGAARPAAALDKGEQSFASMVKDAIGSVMDAGRKSDMQAKVLAAGKANVVDVVTAVAETEVAVETLVSVRDRVIQSYEEIMRMPI
jgi:flagellar hook-basal body complex protein FliE